MININTDLQTREGTRWKWRWLVKTSSGIFVLLGLLAIVRHDPSHEAPTDDLRKQVRELNAEINKLKEDEARPAVILSRYRNSIGYVYGVYHVGFPKQRPEIRARISGTGFLVTRDLVATNRHIAEPWYKDADAEKLIRRGAIPVLEKLVVFFPSARNPIRLMHPKVSRSSDLAVLTLENSAPVGGFPVLPLSNLPPSAGQVVTVIGYPLGIAGMVAKSPSGIEERLAYRSNDINAATELATMSLIRPCSTWGHLGDVIGDKLIYDAPTAHGGSGSPVFNSNGEVIGVNCAYVDGFAGATLGISVGSLRPLLGEPQVHSPK